MSTKSLFLRLPFYVYPYTIVLGALLFVGAVSNPQADLSQAINIARVQDRQASIHRRVERISRELTALRNHQLEVTK